MGSCYADQLRSFLKTGYLETDGGEKIYVDLLTGGNKQKALRDIIANVIERNAIAREVREGKTRFTREFRETYKPFLDGSNSHYTPHFGVDGNEEEIKRALELEECIGNSGLYGDWSSTKGVLLNPVVAGAGTTVPIGVFSYLIGKDYHQSEDSKVSRGEFLGCLTALTMLAGLGGGAGAGWVTAWAVHDMDDLETNALFMDNLYSELFGCPPQEEVAAEVMGVQESDLKVAPPVGLETSEPIVEPYGEISRRDLGENVLSRIKAALS